jgi:hypothetical protein
MFQVAEIMRRDINRPGADFRQHWLKSFKADSLTTEGGGYNTHIICFFIKCQFELNRRKVETSAAAGKNLCVSLSLMFSNDLRLLALIEWHHTNTDWIWRVEINTKTPFFDLPVRLFLSSFRRCYCHRPTSCRPERKRDPISDHRINRFPPRCALSNPLVTENLFRRDPIATEPWHTFRPGGGCGG